MRRLRTLRVARFLHRTCAGRARLGRLLIQDGRAAPQANQAWAPAGQQVDNSTCLFCHSKADFTLTMSGGETLLLTIDEEKFSKSVHGENEIACTSCHTDFTGFPHPELKASSPREIATTYYTTCQQCHSEQYSKYWTASIRRHWLAAT
ncbi:MAG: hypothetical protein IPJ46_02155 [Anaerolineales bacterium]|nr:hypothetical protein [Anaerolineales bacterium]